MIERFHLLLSNGELYPYKVVLSKRAKYIRIKLSREGELSVVRPRGSSAETSHDFLRSKVSWVEKNLSEIKLSSINKFPEVLKFPLLMESWDVSYIALPLECVILIEKSKYQLDLQGDIQNYHLTKKALNKWCQKKAKPLFLIMLKKIAEENGFHFNRLTIRSQKTRWGSCSASKNISLNSKLLFMPESIVRYVMIHELCHTIEMNHSDKFWSLVEECDPCFKQNRKELRVLGRKISF